MALSILKAGLDAEGLPDLSPLAGLDIQGIAQVWALETNTKTNNFIVLSKIPIDFVGKIELKDKEFGDFMAYINAHLARKNLSASQYGGRKQFITVVHVEQAIIDSY